MASINGDLSDTVQVTGPPVPGEPFFEDEVVASFAQAGDVTDQVRMTSLVDAVHSQSAIVTDGFNMSLTIQPGLGKRVFEIASLTAVDTTQTTYNLTMAEITSLRDRLLFGAGVTLTDVTQLGAVLTYQMGLWLTDSTEFTDVLAGAGQFYRSYNEAVRLSDAAGQAALGIIAESISIAGTLQGTALFNQLITDTINAGDSITSAPLVLQVVADDTVEITATDALQMLYAGRINESVQITAVYLSPSGSVTTWALNTKTAALTEYDDYVFNSFARLDGRYLGASENGLYELTGDTDDGADIIAELETGNAQIAGSRFTSFRAAYLAVRGEGRFVLRLKTGDDKVYDYSVTADSMETAKVHLGKGLRARYFSFTLISTGQDFDLESLEFVPIAAQRRV